MHIIEKHDGGSWIGYRLAASFVSTYSSKKAERNHNSKTRTTAFNNVPQIITKRACLVSQWRNASGITRKHARFVLSSADAT